MARPDPSPPTAAADPTRPDDAQLRDLVDRYGRLLFRVAFSITHDEGLAEDVVQDTLLRAWTSMPSWEGDTPVKWMRRVARNRAISVMRGRHRMAEGHFELVATPDPDVERVVEARRLVDDLEGAFAALDDDARLMLVMRETDGLSYEEIAELVGTTTSAVKAKLYRARHALKTELRDWSD